ncbi:MAG: hypothetical protein SPL13_02165 [Clostridia bacterium]|nr:hypothetical protein [Clostridia bacterium]
MSTTAIFWIIVGVVAIIALLIHTYISEAGIDDIEDVFECFIGDGGWITVLIVLGIGAIIFGFVFWIWWAMILIVAAVFTLVLVVLYFIGRDYNDENEEEKDIIKTKFKCTNCGAAIEKITTEDWEKKIVYKCPYCGITYTKKDLLNEKSVNEVKSNEKIELTDFEEEYFNSCFRLFFKPYNNHSVKMIEGKYNSLKGKIDDCEDIYEDIDCFDSEDILQSSKDFLINNEQEINDYILKIGETEIKRRYEFYCELKDADGEEE